MIDKIYLENAQKDLERKEKLFLQRLDQLTGLRNDINFNFRGLVIMVGSGRFLVFGELGIINEMYKEIFFS